MALTLTIVSTKEGVGKTMVAANLAALLADIRQRVLLVDADPQPTLSGYYPIADLAAGGLTRLIVDASAEGTVSRTHIAGLDIVVSDDPEGRLQNWILHTPDGRVRLRHSCAASTGATTSSSWTPRARWDRCRTRPCWPPTCPHPTPASPPGGSRHRSGSASGRPRSGCRWRHRPDPFPPSAAAGSGH